MYCANRLFMSRITPHVPRFQSPASPQTLVVLWLLYVLAVFAVLSYQNAMIGWLCQTLR